MENEAWNKFINWLSKEMEGLDSEDWYKIVNKGFEAWENSDDYTSFKKEQ